MLAGAMARLMVQSPDLVEAASVRRAIDAAWQAVPKQQQITLLPWIGFAELEYADAAATPIARAEELRRMRALLEASRVKGSSADKADLAGGFALIAGRRARPDAQTTRPAAYLAAILREPALTPADEVPAAVDRHLSTMRFLIQLAVDDDLLWTIRTPQRAKGGIRAATWDLNQPVAAQAMGLLTAAETLISLDSLAEKAGKP